MVAHNLPPLVNYERVLTTSNFVRWYFNSIVVALFSTTCVVLFDSLVGYTLCKFEFPGKNLIFLGMLATLMVPTEMLIIPWFDMSVRWSWNTGLAQYWGIAFPGVITAAGVFLMRQFFKRRAQRPAGCQTAWTAMSEIGIWAKIGVPLTLAAMAALAIFNFIGNWNAYLWPLIVASERAYYTLPVGPVLLSRGVLPPSGEDHDSGQSGQCAAALRLSGVSAVQSLPEWSLTGLKG